MEAVVLAGGLGTRLRSVVSEVPKPMALVAGRPFLEYMLDSLVARGFSKAVLAVGYRHEVIEKHFGSCYGGFEIEYSVEDSPLGTGGAIKAALAKCTDEHVFAVNGDTYFVPDFDKMLSSACENAADAVVAVKRMKDCSRYGTVLQQNGRVLQFREKQPICNELINGGVYCIRRTALFNYPDCFSFEKDFLEKRVEDGKIFCIESDSSFTDIGIPQDYALAQQMFSGGAIPTEKEQ